MILTFTTIGHGPEKADWRASPLYLDEWQDVVDGDPTLEYVETLPFGNNPMTGQPLRTPARWSARWRSHPSGVPLVFRWKADHLSLELDDPDAELGELDEPSRQKAAEVASKLHAQLCVKREEWDE